MAWWLYMMVVAFADLFQRDMSGWGKAAWAVGLLIFPFLGVLFYLLTRPQPSEEEIGTLFGRARAAYGLSVADELQKLAALRDAGQLTDAEFQSQKARLLGVGGKPKNEVLLEQSALEALRGLQGDAVGGPSTEQIRRSMAYLLGDLAHAAETTGDRKTADKYYADSVGIWELLNRARPGYEEYEEGLSWSRERLKVRLKKVD